MTHRQQPEELLHGGFLQPDGLEQAVIIKPKPRVTERVEGEVHTDSFLKEMQKIVQLTVNQPDVKIKGKSAFMYLCNFHLTAELIKNIA